jgi:hypothetical protein
MTPVRRKLTRNLLLVLAAAALTAGVVIAVTTSGPAQLGDGASPSAHVNGSARTRRHATHRRTDAQRHALPHVRSLAARYLGLTPTQLRARLRSGRTLAQIADTTSGRSAVGLIESLVNSRAAELEAVPGAGRISAGAESRRRSRLRERMTQEVER